MKILKEMLKMLGQMVMLICMGITMLGVFAFGSAPMLFYIVYGICFLMTMIYIARENLKP